MDASLTTADHDTRRGRRRDAGDKMEPLAQQIADALVRFRGAAHRQTVIDHLAAIKMRRGDQLEAGFAERVIDTFERHCAMGDPEARIFCLPFGPDSHRWSLTRTAQADLLVNTGA